MFSVDIRLCICEKNLNCKVFSNKTKLLVNYTMILKHILL